jgi:hypothetical protein
LLLAHFHSLNWLWFTLGSQDVFPEQFTHLVDWQCLIVDDAVNRVVGVKGSDCLPDPAPAVVFDRMQDEINLAAQIGNTGSDVSGRGILFQYLPKQPGAKYPKGKYRCFLAKVKVFDNTQGQGLQSYLDNARKIIQE